MTRREWTRTALSGLAAAAASAGPVAGAAARQVTGPEAGYRYLHLDVFTDRALTGNQLAVFPEPAGLTAETMQAIAREMNFSETTFVYPAEVAGTDVRVRIFTIDREMPFAGHPVIGTAFALAETGAIRSGQTRAVFGLGIGPTPVDLEWRDGRLRFVWMTQQRPTFGPRLEGIEAVAGALGVDPAAIRATELPIQEVSCGSAFVFVPMATRADVDRALLDRRAMEAIYTTAGMSRRGVFVFSTEAGTDGATAYSRMFGFGVFEDPATGSASGPLGCYLVRHGVVAPERADRITSAQGVKMGRPSRVHIEIGVANGEIQRVRVGGSSVLVGTGTLRTSA